MSSTEGTTDAARHQASAHPAGRHDDLPAAPGLGPGRQRAGRAVRLLPAAERVRAEGQARHPGPGPLGGEDLRGWLRPDLVDVQEPLGLRAQGGSCLRLVAERGQGRRPQQGPAVPPADLRHRSLRRAGRAGPSDGRDVRDLERPHLGGVRRVPPAGLPQLRLQEARRLLQDAAAPRPHAHLADARPVGTAGPAGTPGACPPLRAFARRPAPPRRRCRPRRRSSPRCRWPGARPGRRRWPTGGSAGRSSSAPGCAPTSRRCGHR